MTADVVKLETFYAQLRHEAALLAGGLGDLSQRAAVYHHLFEASKGNHVFPLIAAHGALWANWYFRWGMRLGKVFALQYVGDSKIREKRLADLAVYANAYRDINRRVCIETYSAYYFTRRFGRDPAAQNFIPSVLLEDLNRCHEAQRSGQSLSLEHKRSLFSAFFLWEQEVLVGPGVDAATLAFHWPTLKFVALKPSIRFAYFPRTCRLNFRDFASTAERIEKGQEAFEIAAKTGFGHVEKALRHYQVMPDNFFKNSLEHFFSIRKNLNLASQEAL